MSVDALKSPELNPIRTSVVAKMLNLFVSPTLVFAEVLASAPKLINWLVPTLLVCGSSVFLLEVATTPESTATAIGQMLQEGRVTQAQADLLGSHWQAVARLTMCLSVFAGTLWSAVAIWLLGRFILKRRFRFTKALEISGLSATVLVLAGVVTGLLVQASGDPSARPALSLVCSRLGPDSAVRNVCDVMNVFHFWVVGVLAIGLAQLSRVTVKEAGFWVFGFWIIARLGLIILA